MNLNNKHKFREGEKVRVDGYGACIILELMPYQPNQAAPTYKIKRIIDGFIDQIEEFWIRVLLPNEPQPMCQCGAGFTSKPDDHLTYCPKYVKIILGD